MTRSRGFRIRVAVLATLLASVLGPSAAEAGGRTGAGGSGKTGKVVVLKTSHGDIHIELFLQKAPKTTANFLAYVKSGFFKGTVFHRVIDNFMIQGGGLDRSLNRKATRPPIQNEADNGLRNLRGTVAMARTGDPHSATSQFFINLKYNSFLDHSGKNMRGWGYCVFGRVVKGMDVVDRIRKVATGSQPPHQNVPLTPVVIQNAWVLR